MTDRKALVIQDGRPEEIAAGDTLVDGSGDPIGGGGVGGGFSTDYTPFKAVTSSIGTVTWTEVWTNNQLYTEFTSPTASLQQGNLMWQAQLPAGFSGWGSAGLSLTLKTESTSDSNNKVDCEVYRNGELYCDETLVSSVADTFETTNVIRDILSKTGDDQGPSSAAQLIIDVKGQKRGINCDEDGKIYIQLGAGSKTLDRTDNTSAVWLTLAGSGLADYSYFTVQVVSGNYWALHGQLTAGGSHDNIETDTVFTGKWDLSFDSATSSNPVFGSLTLVSASSTTTIDVATGSYSSGIRLYSDSGKTDLVASGALSASEVTLTEQGSSGISGTVTFEGFFEDNDIVLNMNCRPEPTITGDDQGSGSSAQIERLGLTGMVQGTNTSSAGKLFAKIVAAGSGWDDSEWDSGKYSGWNIPDDSVTFFYIDNFGSGDVALLDDGGGSPGSFLYQASVSSGDTGVISIAAVRATGANASVTVGSPGVSYPEGGSVIYGTTVSLLELYKDSGLSSADIVGKAIKADSTLTAVTAQLESGLTGKAKLASANADSNIVVQLNNFDDGPWEAEDKLGLLLKCYAKDSNVITFDSISPNME